MMMKMMTRMMTIDDDVDDIDDDKDYIIDDDIHAADDNNEVDENDDGDPDDDDDEDGVRLVGFWRCFFIRFFLFLCIDFVLVIWLVCLQLHVLCTYVVLKLFTNGVYVNWPEGPIINFNLIKFNLFNSTELFK